MMPQTPEEIARKYGGTVVNNADAIAAKYGGMVITPEGAKESASPYPSYVNPLAQGVIGFGKSLANTTLGVGRLVGLKPPMFEAKTPSEKIGMFAGDVAPFFIPGPVGKTAVAKYLPKAGPMLARLVRSGIEATGMGTVAAAQGNDWKIPAAIGAAAPVVEPIAQSIAGKWPAAIVNNYLRPLMKQFRFGRNPGQAIVDEGIIAPSTNRLIEQVREAKQGVGRQIGSAVSSPAARAAGKVEVNASLLQPIDDAVKEAVKANDQELVNKLSEFRTSLTDQLTLDPATGKITPTGIKITRRNPEAATGLKQMIGENTRWTGQGYEAPLNQAKAQVYGKLADDIEKLVPEIGPLNERYSNLLEALRSAERKASGNPNIRLSELGGAAIGELVHPGAGIPALLTSFGLRTAPGATMSAQLFRKTPAIGRALKNLMASHRALLPSAYDQNR